MFSINLENKILSVVVTNVLPSYGEVLPEATSQVERDHRAELARLEIEADKLQAANFKLEHDILQQCIMMETSFSGSEGGLDISVHSERSVIQRMLAEEMSFSDSDNSQDLSGELLSEEEYDGPMDLPCEMCRLSTCCYLAGCHFPRELTNIVRRKCLESKEIF